MEKEPLILGQMLKLKLFYENGTISYEGEANSSGHLEGKGKFYNKKGELLFEGNFLMEFIGTEKENYIIIHLKFLKLV